MKKVLFSLLLFMLITNVKAYTNNNNIEISEEEYRNLLSVGFLEKQIDTISYDLYQEYKDTNGIGLVQNVKYYKTTHIEKNGMTSSYTEEIDEEEYLNGDDRVSIKGTGTVYTEYKKLITSLSQTSSDVVTGIVTLEWRKMPKKRSYDIIGIGYLSSSIKRSLSPYFQMDYTTSGNVSYTSMTYNWHETVDNGDTAVAQLPSGSLNSLSSYILVRLKKRIPNSTVNHITVYGDYAHATSNISLTNALKHDMYYTGISLQNSIVGYYDTTPECQATWYGTL